MNGTGTPWFLGGVPLSCMVWVSGLHGDRKEGERIITDDLGDVVVWCVVPWRVVQWQNNGL